MELDSAEYSEKELFQTAAFGKYMWDPDEEEFELFLRSIHHVSQELLEEIEDLCVYTEDEVWKQMRFQCQAHLFRLLASQYIDTLDCLRKLSEPERKDDQGREIYHEWLEKKR